MAVSVADCWHRSKLDCIASGSMLSWMFNEEESQERFRRSDTCQRQKGNGKAAHGQVGKNSGTEPSDKANFTTASYCRSLDKASDTDYITRLSSFRAAAVPVPLILIFPFNVLSVVMGKSHVAC